MVRGKFVKLMVGLLLIAVFASACGSTDPLIGVWREPNSGMIMELTDNGEVVMSLNESSLTLQYQTEDPDVLIFLGTADGTIPEQRMTYRIKENKLILTLDGVNTTFFRVQ
jgi:hypothetical protein